VVIICVSISVIAVVVHFFPLPKDQPFSELYLLGPDHTTANYPYNITVGESYSVVAGVSNHQGTTSSYILYIKLLNETDPLPNIILGTASSLPPVYTYEFTVPDNGTWENKLTFSVINSSFSDNGSQINTLQINNQLFTVNKPALLFSKNSTFNYQLLLELWIINSQSSITSFDDRYVDLRLSLTRTTA
jgi:hypothetical protein